MEIVKKTTSKLFMALLVFASASILFSCSDDAEDNPTPEGELSQAEVQTLLETEDVGSSVDSALAELFNQNGVSSKGMGNECYTAEYTETGFVATFDNCSINGNDNISGTIMVTYGAGENTAAFTATYTDFSVGEITINGTRSFVVNSDESTNAISFTVTSDTTIEFADESTITESGTKTFAIVFEEGQDTLFNLSGNWTIQRDGNTYSIEGDISRQLNCDYWSSGSLSINKNGLTAELDFGDGTCDDKATLTYPNGASEEITL